MEKTLHLFLILPRKQCFIFQPISFSSYSRVAMLWTCVVLLRSLFSSWLATCVQYTVPLQVLLFMITLRLNQLFNSLYIFCVLFFFFLPHGFSSLFWTIFLFFISFFFFITWHWYENHDQSSLRKTSYHV